MKATVIQKDQSQTKINVLTSKEHLMVDICLLLWQTKQLILVKREGQLLLQEILREFKDSLKNHLICHA